MNRMTEVPSAEAHARAIAQYAAEARRAMALAVEAITHLDAAAAIAHARTLKGVVWRAERAGVGLMDLKPAVGPGQPQLGSPHIDAEPHEGN